MLREENDGEHPHRGGPHANQGLQHGEDGGLVGEGGGGVGRHQDGERQQEGAPPPRPVAPQREGECQEGAKAGDGEQAATPLR